ncbi:hypothetical protein FVE85_9430 [Porphyridium purpureum]|uniref:Uncharacterized protein n=1 Tax=Porphyridium purpureum TaxID=35688 RepID=A0A5J4YGV4_PORPP|nr:hypothetical protein FVE85_9430 [Porphyridium purpureum]|eukprot:POR0362..scf269_36
MDDDVFVQQLGASERDVSAARGVSCRVRDFLASHDGRVRTISVVSSGGTAVPLEENMVRFLDNFSTGARGCAVAEEILLREDTLVIFLYRRGGPTPFATRLREMSMGDLHVSQDGTEQHVSVLKEPDGDAASLRSGMLTGLANDVDAYKRTASRMLCVPYFSVIEYLMSLCAICYELKHDPAHALAEHSGRVLIVLAAAVSDFFIRTDELSKHKIQSNAEWATRVDGAANSSRMAHDGNLELTLRPVPKCLGRMREMWAPQHAKLVSFKLETDAQILQDKAFTAIDKYKVDLVVANELHSRYRVVYLCARDLATGGRCVTAIERDDQMNEPRIESALVDALLEL